MTPSTILWIYVVLLIVGGIMGFVKARSKASIIASVAFAIPLALCAAGVITNPWVADVLIALLIVVFAMRLAKTKKFMPSGLMVVISIAALAAHWFAMK